MNISVLCVCNNFWKRFEFCRRSWREALKQLPADHSAHFEVITLDTVEDNTNPFERHCLDPSIFRKRGRCESKPRMLSARLVHQANADYVILTDADLLVPTDLFEKVCRFTGQYAVSDRLETNKHEADQIMTHGSVPASVYERQPLEKKRGMGWFQLIEMRLLLRIWDQLDWNIEGYARSDWQFNKVLQQQTEATVLGFGTPFIHLWHGPGGSTWQGTKDSDPK